MNVLDKVISFVSPQTALKRVEARLRMDIANNFSFGGSGYGSHGASYAKKSLQNFHASGSNADDDIVSNLETLRNRSRDLYMGGGFATGAIKTIRTNVVGSGLMLSANPDYKFLKITKEEADEWRKNTEREWTLWASSVNCDAERRQNFYQLQSLAVISALLSGDVFAILPVIKRPGVPYDLCVGLIEADRVCDPEPKPIDKNIYGGVEIGKYGETLAYWVTKNHPGAAPHNSADWKQEWKRVLAFGAKTGRRNVLHIMCDVERPAQRRGVPLLAPVIELLKQLSRYTEAELMAAVISGMFTIFVKHSTDKNSPLTPMFPSGVPGMGPETAPAEKNAYQMGNGAVVHLDKDEEIQAANPGRPNTAFENFVVAICRQIGTSLEIPYELLVKHFTASYSAARASLLEFWKMVNMRREWLSASFCQPVYEEWLSEAVIKGRVSAPGFFDDPAIRAAWSRADWFGDSQGQLDPEKEANAASIRVDKCFSTIEREAAELTGMKSDEIFETRIREEKIRREGGLIFDNNNQVINGANQDE